MFDMPRDRYGWWPESGVEQGPQHAQQRQMHKPLGVWQRLQRVRPFGQVLKMQTTPGSTGAGKLGRRIAGRMARKNEAATSRKRGGRGQWRQLGSACDSGPGACDVLSGSHAV